MTTDRLAARAREARRVFKYELTPEGPDLVCEVDMPVGAEIIHVHEQHGRPTMWAEVPDWEARGVTTPATTPRIFHLVPTGERVKAEWHAVYVGTVHIDWTVWHIYEGAR